MANTLLFDTDTNGMAHSLEIRVPFLDRGVIDYAYSLPGKLRLPRGGATKHLLRQSFAEFLRSEITGRRKTGFTLPIGRWMSGPLRETCEASIARLRRGEILRPAGVDRVWQ